MDRTSYLLGLPLGLLLIGCSHEPTVVYKRTFDDVVADVNIAPMPSEVSKYARRAALLDGMDSELLKLFLPDAKSVPMWKDVVLAIRIDGQWLFCDQWGSATYKGQTGYLDVLAMERLLKGRLSLPVSAPYWSDIATNFYHISINNKGAVPISVTFRNGRLLKVVAARSNAEFDTWGSTLTFSASGQQIGRLLLTRGGYLDSSVITGGFTEGLPSRRKDNLDSSECKAFLTVPKAELK